MKETNFKMTEIGLIPQDWEVCKIKDVCLTNTGNKNTQDKEDGGKYPFYVRSNTIERINTFTHEGEAVLTAGDGVGTGKVFHYAQGRFAVHQRVYIMNKFEKVDGKYFYWYFANNFPDRVASMTAKSSVDSVRKEMITEMLIPISPLEEQTRIASALSEVDALLSSLDKLIAKKQAIKQGTMQQLLSGKTRLDGFDGEWKETSLGKLCDIYGRIGFRGYTKEDLVEKGFGAITFSPSDIHNQQLDTSDCDYISFEKYEESPEIKVFEGDILFCKTASVGKCAIVSKIKEKATINPQFVVLKNFSCNNRLLYYTICTKPFQDSVRSITGGSTIPTLSQEKMKELRITIPNSIEEQEAIVNVLASMDSELSALQAKRKKYEAIKQGMMQQLLTGKIRLN